MKKLLTLLVLSLPFLASAQVEGTLVGAWSSPGMPGSSAYDNAYNEVWGHAIAGKEYGIIGSTAGYTHH